MKKKVKKTPNTLATLVVMMDAFSQDMDAFSARVDALSGTIDMVRKTTMQGFQAMDSKMDAFENLLQGTNNRIDDLATHRATKEEMYHIGLRLEKVEKKLGMKR